MLYTEDLVVQSGHAPNNTTPSLLRATAQARLLSFDVLALEISLGYLSILWYRWTFQTERQLAVGSSLHWTLDCQQRPSGWAKLKSCHNSKTKTACYSSKVYLHTKITVYFVASAEIFCGWAEWHTHTHTCTHKQRLLYASRVLPTEAKSVPLSEYTESESETDSPCSLSIILSSLFMYLYNGLYVDLSVPLM